MIREFRVRHLNGRLNCNLRLHEDINILTGKNGAGKTTVLKLLWYMISGNIERIPLELSFETAEIETDSYRLTLQMSETKTGRRTLHWVFLPLPEGESREGTSSGHASRIEPLNRMVVRTGSSLFFPTFRRIEGGFSMMDTRPRLEQDDEFSGVFSSSPYMIEPSFARLSRTLSVGRHRFIASVSTSDIVSSLTSSYANVSEQINEDHRTLSQEIYSLVHGYGEGAELSIGSNEKLSAAQKALSDVQELVRSHSKKQDDLLRPFTALSELIARIFQHKGIRVTARITLGDAQEAIASQSLSAGEKQMLSFLVYNAFESASSIFIDEPEISLHVDWQRQIFPTLLSQGTSNQFIIATHSPFIYSNYSDRELVLDSDRGE